jgi:hypothetical protein
MDLFEVSALYWRTVGLSNSFFQWLLLVFLMAKRQQISFASIKIPETMVYREISCESRLGVEITEQTKYYRSM